MDSWILCWNMGPDRPSAEVPAPKARRGAQHVMDFGDGLDVGVDVSVAMASLWPRIDWSALISPPWRIHCVANVWRRPWNVISSSLVP